MKKKCCIIVFSMFMSIGAYAENKASVVVEEEVAVKILNLADEVSRVASSSATKDFFDDSSESDDLTSTYTVSGTIYDLKGNEAIVGAVVEINGLSTFSDLWGNYMLMGVERGLQKIIVRHLSYKQKEIELDLKKSRKLDIEIERMK